MIAHSVFGLILQSDGLTQAVLVLLLLMSTFCWSSWIYYTLIMREYRLDLRRLIKHVTASNLYPAYEQYAARDIKAYCVKKLYHQTTHTLTEWQRMSMRQQGVTEADWHYLESCLATMQEDMHMKLGAGRSSFMFCAEAAPLLGLFGTVWGLIHAFMRIAQFQSADIATVAPGIAEALITTLAGLLVALPALAMFHQMNARYKMLMSLLARYIDSCSRLAHYMAHAPSELIPSKEIYDPSQYAPQSHA